MLAVEKFSNILDPSSISASTSTSTSTSTAHSPSYASKDYQLRLLIYMIISFN